MFDDAEACPCGPIEDCLMLGTSRELTKKLIGQLLAIYLTYK